MEKFIFQPVAVMLAAVLAVGPALAKNDDGPGRGHGHGHGKDRHEKHGRREGGDRAGRSEARQARVGAFFTDRDRDNARRYYAQQYGGRGNCPPGLAKKNNGCLPPGQAKKYVVGQPLPAGAVVYPVPPAVLVTLPPPPVGHKYVRMAADILLIAVGTSLVVDGISDLMRL